MDIATASPHSLTLAELVAEDTRTRGHNSAFPRFLHIRDEIGGRNYACPSCSARWHAVGDLWRPCAPCKGRHVIPRETLARAEIINLGREDALVQMERAGWGKAARCKPGPITQWPVVDDIDPPGIYPPCEI